MVSWMVTRSGCTASGCDVAKRRSSPTIIESREMVIISSLVRVPVKSLEKVSALNVVPVETLVRYELEL